MLSTMDTHWTPATQELTATPTQPLVYMPNLPAGFTLEPDAASGNVKVLNASGTLVGHFFPMALDYNEQQVPTTLGVVGNPLCVRLR
jgi:hypothetical protein